MFYSSRFVKDTNAFWYFCADIRTEHYLCWVYVLSLSWTFDLVSSAFSLTSLINPFGISNSAIWNFHYVPQFPRFLQSFLDCFRSAISNIRMRFSNKSYSTVHFLHSNVNKIPRIKCQLLPKISKYFLFPIAFKTYQSQYRSK